MISQRGNTKIFSTPTNKNKERKNTNLLKRQEVRSHFIPDFYSSVEIENKQEKVKVVASVACG